MVNFETMFLLKMTILSPHEAQALNGQFSNNILIEMTILTIHEAQASNGQFSNNVLIENEHSERPRGAGSEWSILKECPY